MNRRTRDEVFPLRQMSLKVPLCIRRQIATHAIAQLDALVLYLKRLLGCPPDTTFPICLSQWVGLFRPPQVLRLHFMTNCLCLRNLPVASVVITTETT